MPHDEAPCIGRADSKCSNRCVMRSQCHAGAGDLFSLIRLYITAAAGSAPPAFLILLVPSSLPPAVPWASYHCHRYQSTSVSHMAHPRLPSSRASRPRLPPTAATPGSQSRQLPLGPPTRGRMSSSLPKTCIRGTTSHKSEPDREWQSANG